MMVGEAASCLQLLFVVFGGLVGGFTDAEGFTEGFTDAVGATFVGGAGLSVVFGTTFVGGAGLVVLFTTGFELFTTGGFFVLVTGTTDLLGAGTTEAVLVFGATAVFFVGATAVVFGFGVALSTPCKATTINDNTTATILFHILIYLYILTTAKSSKEILLPTVGSAPVFVLI